MAVKRRRPTREELDERIRIVLGKIPADVDVHREPAPAEPVPIRSARPSVESGRIVSGTITSAAEAG